MCGCSYTSSATATSDRPGSSGPPTLPTRRPGQDHGSGAVCARLPRAKSAGRPASLAPARDAILDTHVLTPTANRPLPQACGLGHHLDPAVPQCERFAGRPAAASALIQLRRKAGELSSQDFYNARVYHVINVV